MKMHFLFLIKDKDLSVAELFRGASDDAKYVNGEMVGTEDDPRFPSYKQTKDPERLVSSLVEDGLVEEVERKPPSGGKPKRVIGGATWRKSPRKRGSNNENPTRTQICIRSAIANA